MMLVLRARQGPRAECLLCVKTSVYQKEHKETVFRIESQGSVLATDRDQRQAF